MKLIIVVACAFMAVAVAAPAEPEPVKIVRSGYEQNPDGSYRFVSETENGIKQEEQGELKDVETEEGKIVKALIVRGSYSYTDPNGDVQTISYVADQNGFHPDGPSIPKNP